MAYPFNTGPSVGQARVLIHVLALWLLFSASPARADNATDSVGQIGWPAVNLTVPVMPNIIDEQGIMTPPMRLWLDQVARTAQIRIDVRAANFSRRKADLNRNADYCVMGYARLPDREKDVLWLAEVRRDRIVFVARADDPFAGNLDDFLAIASGHVAAPSGVYREELARQGIEFEPIDDQKSLARMVQTGRVRFGMLVTSTLTVPEVRAMDLRIVAYTPPVEFWLACSLQLATSKATALQAGLLDPSAEMLRRSLFNEPAATDHQTGPFANPE